MKDILLNNGNGLQFSEGDLAIGESLMQEVACILKANQGEYKEHPLVGANLIEMINGREDREEINDRIKIQMKLDGKDYNEIKRFITNELKTQ